MNHKPTSGKLAANFPVSNPASRLITTCSTIGIISRSPRCLLQIKKAGYYHDDIIPLGSIVLNAIEDRASVVLGCGTEAGQLGRRMLLEILEAALQTLLAPEVLDYR